ncbi:MAG: hypothetical protein JSV38_11845, partial [Desulfobacterales bacterium]
TCIYMLPLMTDQKLGLIDAIKTSYAVSMKGSIADHSVMIILFLGIIMIGNAVFIGSLFTQPLATVFLLLIYDEKIKDLPDNIQLPVDQL